MTEESVGRVCDVMTGMVSCMNICPDLLTACQTREKTHTYQSVCHDLPAVAFRVGIIKPSAWSWLVVEAAGPRVGFASYVFCGIDVDTRTDGCVSKRVSPAAGHCCREKQQSLTT